MPRLNITPSQSKEFFMKIDKFVGGTQTLINSARIDKHFAIESANLIQYADGVWRTRQGLRYYGQEISGVSNIDGATEYIKTNGVREIIAVAGGYAWKSQDGGAWTQLTGATFMAGIRPFFLQIGDKLYITNGTDALSYYNGTALLTYTEISAPVGLAGVRTTLTSGSYNNYYRVVAVNDVGYTNASASINVTSNKHRDTWSSATEYITLTWTAVSGAIGYQVYWGSYDGKENLIARIETNTYKDDNTSTANPYLEIPDDNTTGAPKFKSMEISGNRLWGTYDSDNKYRVYFSGTGQYMAYFSPFYGGGYIDVEKGGRNIPTSVVHYRTGKGEPIITVLCSSPDGNGSIFQVELTATTVGDVTFTIPSAYKVVGSIGADTPYGVVKAGDNIMFINRKGIFSLRNKEQMFNVLSTDDLSAPIRNMMEKLNTTKIVDFCAYYKAPVVYFTVAEGDVNDRTILFDLERNNWNYAWDVGFRQLFEYTENNTSLTQGSKKTKFLAVSISGNQLVEISDDVIGQDFGGVIYQKYKSPILNVSQDCTTQASVKEVVFELGQFKGIINLEVVCYQERRTLTISKQKQSDITVGDSGIGDDYYSDFLASDTIDYPTLKPTNNNNIKVRLPINRITNSIQFVVWSYAPNTFWELLRIQAKGTYIEAKANNILN